MVETSPMLWKHERHQDLKIYYIKKIKQNAIIGWTMATTMKGQQCLIPGVVAGVVGLLQVLQDDVHRLQDISGCAKILRDPQDRGHAKVH
jgi:hypothetical protein